MSKEVNYGVKVMEKMLVGLDKAALPVIGTIGPKGLNVYIQDPMEPKITNDGATIASQIVLDDPVEDAGAYVIRNTSSQTNDDVGDGTTTTATLTHALVHECVNRPENPMLIKQSLKEAGDKVLKILAKKSIKIDQKDIEKVAIISSEDKKLAKIINEIIGKLGDKAVINVEDSKTFATEYEIVDGYEAHVGFMSPHFITDKKTARAIYTDIPVLVTAKKISNIIDIQPIFKQFEENKVSQCVIVCDDIDDSMLGMLVMNKNMGRFNALVIRATGELLEDIAGSVGADIVSDATGINFSNVELSNLGLAKKIVCDANKTIFIGDNLAAFKYANNLESKANSEPNQYIAKRMQDRVAKLRGSIAVLKIGASTDPERNYLKYKAEDAVKAVQAALAEGIVEGGGMTLYNIAEELEPKTIGEEIIKKALKAPLQQIIKNAGKDYTEILLNMPDGQGYDAKRDCYCDLMEAGIIDPVKVERCSLENAVSAASTFITTFSCITEKEDNGK